MAAADTIVIFGANSVALKYDPMFYFTQNCFLCMYVGFVYVILKYLFIVSSHICQWAIISGVLGGRIEKKIYGYSYGISLNTAKSADQYYSSYSYQS